MQAMSKFNGFRPDDLVETVDFGLVNLIQNKSGWFIIETAHKCFVTPDFLLGECHNRLKSH